MKAFRTLFPVLLLGFATPALAGDVTVTIGHGKLEPPEVIVAVGDTVTFHNVDKMPGGHSIVADDGSFESPGLGAGDSWSHTFEKLGMFPYHIGEHPDAKGRVIVE